MLFNSIDFLIFYPTVVVFFFILPHRFRWGLLLAASYFFYMFWKPEYILLIIISTLIDYFAAIYIHRTHREIFRKLLLFLSLLSNLGLLFTFKYFNFFLSSFNFIFPGLENFIGKPTFLMILPVGISFYTFQSMSYTIDVFRREREPERHIGLFALYVSFFPQLVAGPIERSTQLLPQFREKVSFDYCRIMDGFQLMLWGFFKKIVIADRLAIFVDQVYGNPTAYKGLPLWIATYFFAFQIFCDFSGYSDIAIGAAQIMGFKLMDNFKQPYFSKSIAEFWRRWHISLSTWFRDYLYIPLGGNRVPRYRWYYNLFVVFLISGLWHGANWTFVIWGALHGLYILCGIWTKNIRYKITKFVFSDSFKQGIKFLNIIFTFHLVLFSWIFFRASSIKEALYIVTHLFSNFKFESLNKINFAPIDYIIAAFSLMILESVHLIQRRLRIRQYLKSKPVWLRWSIYYLVIIVIIFLGEYGDRKFIYFQF